MSTIFVLLFACSYNAIAQPAFDDDVVDTQVNEGVAVLVASGLMFGLMKIKKLNTEK